MIEKCPLCDNFVSQVKYIFGEYIYKQCPICSAMFVANEFSSSDLAKEYSESYYEADSFDGKGRKGYPSYLKAQESLRDSFLQKLRVVREQKPSGKLLDAGAAYGSFLQLASEHYKCVGLELSEYAAEMASSEFKMDVRVGSIERAPFPDEEFDVIVMWDIIEHLPNPLLALQEVRRMLKKGGVCLISTDDVSNWFVKLLGRKWWGIAPPLHLCHFSKKGMQFVFERVGNFSDVEFEKDYRRYGLTEIINHLGVSYQNKALLGAGKYLGKTILGKVMLNVARPEQFIAIAHKL
jgi:SAM-dependent methyltransferase